MTGRLPKGEKAKRDAVAARLKPAQTRKDEANPAGFSPKKRAEQNRRVANRLPKQD